MILPKAQQLLLPVSRPFMVASIAVALALDLLPLGRITWTPDWLMVLLAFWGLHQPRYVGMGAAFVLGLAIDVDHSTLLGEHALVYCLLVFGVQALQRRLLWFGPCGRPCSCCRSLRARTCWSCCCACSARAWRRAGRRRWRRCWRR